MEPINAGLIDYKNNTKCPISLDIRTLLLYHFQSDLTFLFSQ